MSSSSKNAPRGGPLFPNASANEQGAGEAHHAARGVDPPQDTSGLKRHNDGEFLRQERLQELAGVDFKDQTRSHTGSSQPKSSSSRRQTTAAASQPHQQPQPREYVPVISAVPVISRERSQRRTVIWVALEYSSLIWIAAILIILAAVIGGFCGSGKCSRTTNSSIVSPQLRPSVSPVASPSRRPSGGPTTSPSAAPSSEPSSEPSKRPSGGPTTGPSAAPSTEPSAEPSSRPSGGPTTRPTPLGPNAGIAGVYRVKSSCSPGLYLNRAPQNDMFLPSTSIELYQLNEGWDSQKWNFDATSSHIVCQWEADTCFLTYDRRDSALRVGDVYSTNSESKRWNVTRSEGSNFCLQNGNDYMTNTNGGLVMSFWKEGCSQIWELIEYLPE